MTSFLMGLATLSLLFLFNNCGDGFKSSGKTMESLSSTGGTVTPPPAPSTGAVVLSTSKPTNTSELNKTFKVPIVIDRTGAMATKTLSLRVTSTEIDALDPMNGFNATITPSSLAPGVSFAEVTVTIATFAPSLTAQHFHVEAYDGSLIVKELEINLTIQPVIRFQIAGTAIGDANWLSNGTSVTNLFMANTRTIPFIHHPTPGLQVLFENLAPAAHTIHSSGSIPHGNTQAPLAASADGTTAGGTYMPARIIGTARSNAMVYTHDVPDSGNSRQLLFNANL